MYSLDNKGYLSLMGRLLMATIFLLSGMNKILHPQETQQYMAAYGMGATSFFLLGAIVMELGAGFALLVGFATRLAAAVLILFTVTAALIFHTNFGDQMQMIHFLKNMAMVGGLTYIYAYGAGRISLDAQRWGTVARALPPEAGEARRLGRTGYLSSLRRQWTGPIDRRWIGSPTNDASRTTNGGSHYALSDSGL